MSLTKFSINQGLELVPRQFNQYKGNKIFLIERTTQDVLGYSEASLLGGKNLAFESHLLALLP